MRDQVVDQLANKHIAAIEADSIVTGMDFLDKIWRQIFVVPLGVAIIDQSMAPKTVANTQQPVFE